MGDDKLSRREMLRHAALAGLGIAGAPSLAGAGLRGRGVLREFLNVPGVRVTALCDVVEEKVLQAKALVEQAGQQTPALYFKGERGYEEAVRREDIDFVYIATPWE